MNKKIKKVNEFWAKVCQMYDESTREKSLFIFQDNYHAEEIVSIDNWDIDEDVGLSFVTKLQWCSYDHGCTCWEYGLSEIVSVDSEKMILTVDGGTRYKFRVENEDYNFGHERSNREYYPF